MGENLMINHDPLTQLLHDALEQRASDIHFEPAQSTVTLRYRIDGLLQCINALPKTTYLSWLVRFKTLAGLDIAQSLRPQDGRFSFETQARYHFRIHTCPTVFGEKMVIRLLPESQSILTLKDLGLHAAQYDAMLTALHQRSGLIIVTGPTGSGKTMTLYACLEWLKTQSLQITTLEDPVEIPLEGTTQIAIHEKQGLTFASALRAVLRQDPDVILVGEMRDFETADIAIRAALTGHLVLTTLHTPNAQAAIRRLENMNIPAYNLNDSLSLIVSQRLVRRTDPHQQEQYHGRLGIFEIMTPQQHYIDHLSLKKAGYLHVCQHRTTQTEVDRVL
jgi:type II secretory ATPase GspE/PulE/Tfp pilus assembly ATPase PilB-like protein